MADYAFANPPYGLAQHLVIQIGMHVGDGGAARLETVDPRQRVVDAWREGRELSRRAVKTLFPSRVETNPRTQSKFCVSRTADATNANSS